MSPDTFSLAGKTAFVTGSGRENGIGAAVARALARNGAAVAIHHVSEESKPRVEKAARNFEKEFHTQTTVVQGSVDSSDTANCIVEQTLKALNIDHIDILVNKGAVANHTPLLEARAEQIEHEFGVNVFGLIYLTQAVVHIGRMPKGCRIINIGSVISKLLHHSPPLGKSHGITVNTLVVGALPTDMSNEVFFAPDGSPTAVHQYAMESTRAADRLGTAEDIAEAALLLVAEKSRWITAQFISVSGGITGTM